MNIKFYITDGDIDAVNVIKDGDKFTTFVGARGTLRVKREEVHDTLELAMEALIKETQKRLDQSERVSRRLRQSIADMIKMKNQELEIYRTYLTEELENKLKFLKEGI